MISFLIDFSMLKLENQMLLLGGDSSSRVGTYESRSYFILFVIFFATIAMLKIEIATCNTKFTKVVSVLFKKTAAPDR